MKERWFEQQKELLKIVGCMQIPGNSTLSIFCTNNSINITIDTKK